ncbi:MAG: zinc dependent phospholipase C family protein [Desulfovermiculus sp.]
MCPVITAEAHTLAIARGGTWGLYNNNEHFAYGKGDIKLAPRCSQKPQGLWKKIFFLLGIVLGLGVLAPASALAWGPGMHLALGNQILNNLHLLSASVAEILAANVQAFRYGCLSADILVGKGRRLTPTHCHSWQAGLRMIHTVVDPRLQAYAYGYLSHLAADVVAHNYYVANVLQLGRARGKLTHVYIEMQADRQTIYCPTELKRVMKTSLPDADALLLSTLRKSRLTFSLKKRLFKSGVALSRNATTASSLQLLSRQFPDRECGEYLCDMRELSFQASVDCLNRGHESVVVTFDPMGFENLGLVKQSLPQKAGSSISGPFLNFFIPAMSLLTL